MDFAIPFTKKARRIRKCLCMFEQALAECGIPVRPQVSIVSSREKTEHVLASAEERTITISSDFFDQNLLVPLYTLVRAAAYIDYVAEPNKTRVIDLDRFMGDIDRFERRPVLDWFCAAWNAYAERHNLVVNAMRLPACSLRS
ncbi:hypothetical protein OIU34_20360 [Pararhizobium sp. BT-229]|uniref:hypothetical protein n=1 Tax=Pararhizobium sp. BT-229 TaxID=2986923 RepID=UPI0021F7E400|nr:hypothetical protein [Pararhizobium sp. BT-229]MCV9964242.1 hypothetical protein [Pararhizobium sp. BT-229]